MPELKGVELIRRRIANGLIRELTRLRGFISMTPGNQAAVDKLHGKSGNMILAEVTDLVLRRLGHDTGTPVDDGNNAARREFQSRNRVR